MKVQVVRRITQAKVYLQSTERIHPTLTYPTQSRLTFQKPAVTSSKPFLLFISLASFTTFRTIQKISYPSNKSTRGFSTKIGYHGTHEESEAQVWKTVPLVRLKIELLECKHWITCNHDLQRKSRSHRLASSRGLRVTKQLPEFILRLPLRVLNSIVSSCLQSPLWRKSK